MREYLQSMGVAIGVYLAFWAAVICLYWLIAIGLNTYDKRRGRR